MCSTKLNVYVRNAQSLDTYVQLFITAFDATVISYISYDINLDIYSQHRLLYTEDQKRSKRFAYTMSL